MKQRVPRRAWFRAGPVHRPRILIEDDRPAFAISDFSQFQRAGFDVAFCTGPQQDPAECPLLTGGDCPIAAGADVVLHGLDPRLGIAAAIGRRYRSAAVLHMAGHTDQGAPPAASTVLVPDCSVPGLVEAARRAVPRQASSPGHSPTRG